LKFSPKADCADKFQHKSHKIKFQGSLFSGSLVATGRHMDDTANLIAAFGICCCIRLKKGSHYLMKNLEIRNKIRNIDTTLIISHISVWS